MNTAHLFKRFKNRPRVRPVPGMMNKTEQEYAGFLQQRLLGGIVKYWEYEPVKLKLAPKTFYTPDFLVITADEIGFHEVKGYWEDDARVKIKCAAEKYWFFAFVAIKRSGKNHWDMEMF